MPGVQWLEAGRCGGYTMRREEFSVVSNQAPMPRRYEATIERAGWSLAAGSALGGLIVLGLVLRGGQYDPLALAAAWALGSVLMGLGITAVAGPLWLVMHVAGWRRPRHAAIVGAIASLAIFVGAQTYGFGLLDMPPTDNRALLYRWLSATATSGVIAVAAALIGLVMWRIAYRRQQ